MKTEKNILIAFVLNLAFAILEFLGGIFTGSVAILSDAIHDLGDAVSIGLSCFLEKKSRKQPDEVYTYGYARYSVLGGAITTFILLAGSVAVIFHALLRIMEPKPINYDGMLLFAVVGVAVNFFAAWVTREGHSINQKAVNLHMLEDVLGWLAVLVGAVVMRFTGWALIDPLMSIGVALFILSHCLKNLKQIMDLFLMKVPQDLQIHEVQKQIIALGDVVDVHHIHIWSMDGENHYATMHVVTIGDPHRIKDEIRMVLRKHHIGHVTLELEAPGEHCEDKVCHNTHQVRHHHHHH